MKYIKDLEDNSLMPEQTLVRHCLEIEGRILTCCLGQRDLPRMPLDGIVDTLSFMFFKHYY